MDKKALYIIRNICITNLSVLVDGKPVRGKITGGDFKTFSRELYKSFDCDYPKFYKMDNLCKLAFLGVELLLKDTQIESNPENTAVLLANSGSTIDTDSNFVDTLNKIPSPAIFVYTLPNIAAGELCIRHGWKGENLFLISENFIAEDHTENLQMLYASSTTRVCITGWINYLSDTDYKACLWIISDKPDKNNRTLCAKGLSSDFTLN